MKLRRLEMMLEKVRGFESPSAAMEQYQTPAPLAARLLYTAFMNGDIEGCQVCDLGSGTGILSIGAALLGADAVTGVESDPEAIRMATENARNLGREIRFIQADMNDPDTDARIDDADTIIMNPPFGAQQEHADRPFIDMALKKGKMVYGIFNQGSEPFIRRYIGSRAEIISVIQADLTIRRLFSFHRDDYRDIPVEIIILKSLEKKEV